MKNQLKFRFLLMLIFFISASICNAQTDTLFVMKNGDVLWKQNTNEIDSVIFYHPSASPSAAKDSMYVMRYGGIIWSEMVSEIDSLIFYNPINYEPPIADFTGTPTTVNIGDEVQFADQSSNEPTSWLWIFGDGETSTLQNPSHTYNTLGTYTVSLTVTNDYGQDTETKSDYITVTDGGPCAGITPPSGYGIVESSGNCWLDRNLGASQVATSSTDEAAYGDLYQWGRKADGHQVRTSGTTSTLSNTDNPGHGNFITTVSIPFDWRSGQNDNLWQGVSGTNNPCPSGWRIPTEAEWNAERSSWSADAFASPLKLPLAGNRGYISGSLSSVGFDGYYWSSSVEDTHSSYLWFNSGNSDVSSSPRARGHSVRCLKD